MVVPASFVADGMGGFLRCLSPSALTALPPPTSTSSVFLELSLNEQDYTSQGDRFTMYPVPHLIAISPSSGPARGNTTVRFFGSSLLNGSDYRCSFGTPRDAHAVRTLSTSHYRAAY